MNTSGSSPRFSIGMPVFNGSAFIENAIDSVLRQTVPDWELVISDNASTDDTEIVCQRYAASDARIHYHRNEHNLGAHPNYNQTLKLARGKYFKWLAHDDALAPEFLELCGDQMATDPNAVLCMSDIRYIDAEGQDIGVMDMAFPGSLARHPATRFSALVNRGHTAYHVFALIRRTTLLDSVQLMSFHGSDRALIADLCLRGPLLHEHAPLMLVREHKARYTRAKTKPKERAAWHDAKLAGKASLPTWRLYGEYLKILRAAEVSASAKARCTLTLGAWWFRNWHAARAMVDVVAVLVPGFVATAERFKQRIFSPAPGSDQLRR